MRRTQADQVGLEIQDGFHGGSATMGGLEQFCCWLGGQLNVSLGLYGGSRTQDGGNSNCIAREWDTTRRRKRGLIMNDIQAFS
jgi:hypothetical protein